MSLPEKSKVLFVAPHPDDAELGCGGTIQVFVERGFDVVCVFLTKGEKGGDPQIRMNESVIACTGLGVERHNIFFGPFPDTKIPESCETIEFLEQFYDHSVWAVFLPPWHDIHQDHRATAMAGITAYRRAPSIFHYESPSVTPDFTPNVFVDVTGRTKAKGRALRCHRSQLEQSKMYMEYRSTLRLAAFRGYQAGCRFAEAFEIHRQRLHVPEIPNT